MQPVIKAWTWVKFIKFIKPALLQELIKKALCENTHRMPSVTQRQGYLGNYNTSNKTYKTSTNCTGRGGIGGSLFCSYVSLDISGAYLKHK